MIRMKNPEGKVEALLNELMEYRSIQKNGAQELYHKLKDRYPYEKYGCNAQMKIDDKMLKYYRHLKEVDLYITCLQNTIYDVQERMRREKG